MTQTQVWTIGKLLEWTTDYLRKNGSESPRLDAEVLLAHARNCPRIQLYTAFAEEPLEAERAAFREMVRRRSEGTPVAYLVGHKEFYSLDFVVSSDCLIPRPETEHLVMAAIDWGKARLKSIAEAASSFRIADICTGSGCVAISVAHHLTKGEIAAVDVCPKALAVAKTNVSKHGLDERISLWEGDLLEAIPNEDGNFDMILSNPPYVSEEEWAGLAKDVRDHEPRLALVSGAVGTEISVRLLDQASTRLKVGGVIMIESSPMVVPKLEEYLQSQSQWTMKPTLKDLQGHARIIVAERIR
jgi:release factor glutamine methyltransferase